MLAIHAEKLHVFNASYLAPYHKSTLFVPFSLVEFLKNVKDNTI